MNILDYVAPITNLQEMSNLLSLILFILITAAFDVLLFLLLKKWPGRIYTIVCEVVLLLSWLFGLTPVCYAALAGLIVGVTVIFVLNPAEAKLILGNPFAAAPGMVKKKKHRKNEGEVLFDREAMYEKIQAAVISMAKQKIGALITLEKEDLLDDVCKSGTIVEAPVSTELLQTIFFPKTRLHDGAVVIRNDKIYAASVYYQPTNRPLEGKFGSRHRAGIGISEICDAVTIIVSEETGRISLAYAGELVSVNADNFLSTLEEYMSMRKVTEEEK